MNTEQDKIEVPKGYMVDARGNLVKRSNIKDIDLSRDRLVRSLWVQAEKVERLVRGLRQTALEGINALVRERAERKGVTMSGAKGNVTLTSYDGQLRVQRGVGEEIAFTEELEVARHS